VTKEFIVSRIFGLFWGYDGKEKHKKDKKTSKQ
jgi:hypothetical protein